MNGRLLNGKPLVVNIAQRRDQRYSMLQVQFQQRLQAIMRQLPMFSFGGAHAPPQQPQLQQGSGPRRQMRQQGQQGQQGQTKAQPPYRQLVGRGRGGDKHHAENAPTQAPYTASTRSPQQAPAVPETPPLAPITADELLSMSPDEQKMALGERLYVKVSELAPEFAPKITGMLIEMEAAEALALLDNPTKLAAKVDEAQCVLKAHQISS